VKAKPRVAAEHVPKYAEKLGVSDSVAAGAERLADQFHGTDPEHGPLQNQPSTIAVGCLYVSSTMRESGLTRDEIANKTGKSNTRISLISSKIADALVGETIDGSESA